MQNSHRNILAIAVLLVAALLSCRSLVAAAVTIVLIGSLGADFLALRQMVKATGSLPGSEPATLVPVLIGFVSALVVQRQRGMARTLGGAGLAWNLSRQPVLLRFSARVEHADRTRAYPTCGRVIELPGGPSRQCSEMNKRGHRTSDAAGLCLNRPSPLR